MRADRDGDGFGWNRRIWFTVRVGLVALRVPVVIELVGQEYRVEVAVLIECADRVRVVGPTLISRNVSLNRPGLSSVRRFEEAEKVVVTLGAHEPFGLPDDVIRVGRVYTDVGFRVVFDELGFRGRIARVASSLGGVRGATSGVFAGVRAGAAGHTVVAVRREETRGVGHLRAVTACPLGGGEGVCDAGVTGGVRRVALGPLRNVADPERVRTRRDRGEGDDDEGRAHSEARSAQHPGPPLYMELLSSPSPAASYRSRTN